MPSKNEAIVSAVLRLEKSPLFNLSMGGKELFHSDFLYWLCKSHPEEVIPIFARRMHTSPDMPTQCDINREKKHYDLKFTFTDKNVLIVENKVKSIPTEKQLWGYSKPYNKMPEYSFLLLSLVKPAFAPITDGKIQLSGLGEEQDQHGAIWAVMDYEELAKELKSILPTVEKNDLYHGRLLSDYVEFISLLNNIARETRIDSTSNENFFAFKESMASLIKHRMHDLVYKRIYSDMSHIVAAKLRDRDIAVRLGDVKDGRKGDIYVDSNFTNMTGMFTAYYVVLENKEVGGPCLLFIQVQDNQFRLFLYLKNKKRSVEVARILAEEKIWFNFDRVESFGIKRKRKEKPFNRFLGSHLYRYKLIDNISPDKLAEVTIEYIKQAKMNASRVRAEVEKAAK